MRTVIAIAAALACAWLGAGDTGRAGADPPRSDWTQFRYDAAHTGFNRAENELSPENVGRLREAWHVDTGSTSVTPVELAPVVQGPRVYLSTVDGRVEARDATTGVRLWSTRINASGLLLASPATAGTSVYAVSDEGVTIALDSATGSLRWAAGRSDIHGVRGEPTVTEPAVFVAGTGFSTFDPGSGATLWNREQSFCGPPCSPAVAGGIEYVPAGPASGEQIFALDAATGAVRWSFRPRVVVSGPRHLDFGWSGVPAVAGGRLYVVGARGWTGHHRVLLDAFDARTGKRRWQAGVGESPNSPVSGPAIANGVVYYGSGGRELFAFRAATGKRLWRVSLGGSGGGVSSPAVANGVVYVGTGASLVAVDARTGRRLWSAETNGDTTGSPPVVAGGALYALNLAGRLYRFDLGG